MGRISILIIFPKSKYTPKYLSLTAQKIGSLPMCRLGNNWLYPGPLLNRHDLLGLNWISNLLPWSKQMSIQYKICKAPCCRGLKHLVCGDLRWLLGLTHLICPVPIPHPSTSRPLAPRTPRFRRLGFDARHVPLKLFWPLCLLDSGASAELTAVANWPAHGATDHAVDRAWRSLE